MVHNNFNDTPVNTTQQTIIEEGKLLSIIQDFGNLVMDTIESDTKFVEVKSHRETVERKVMPQCHRSNPLNSDRNLLNPC